MTHDSDPLARLRSAAGHTSAPELHSAVVTGAPDRRAPRLVRRGRAARGVGIGVTALAAVTATALVIGNPFATPAPLFAAASGSGTAAGAMAEDARIALWIDYEYLPGAELSDAGGRGHVYELRRAGDPLAVARELAVTFGLSGQPSESQYSSPEYPSYVVGPEDGSAPSLALSWMGTGSWWYSDSAAYPAAVCEQVTSTNTDGTSESWEDCRIPEVPASQSKAPSEAEARALAAELFAATGFDVAASDIRVTADATQTSATASLTVDGVATALEWTVSWSPLGEIAWASGHAVDVVERGEYDTISARDAVQRLEDGRWFGAAGPDYSGGMVMYAADSLARGAKSPDASAGADAGTAGGVDAGSPAAGATGEPGTEPATPREPAPTIEPDAPVATDDPLVPSEPGEGEPGEGEPGEAPVMPEPQLPLEPETVTVTLDTAEATLVLVWDVDGNAWLVPGYAYEQPTQGFWTAIISLVEGVIQLPEPMTAEPLPADDPQ